MSAGPRTRSGSRVRLGIVALVAGTLCCGGPALVAGGALTAAGEGFDSPLLLTLGLALVALVVAMTFWHRARGRDACPPSAADRPSPLADRRTSR